MDKWTFRYKLSERIKDGEADRDERDVYAEYIDDDVLTLIKTLDKERKKRNELPVDERRDYWHLDNTERRELYNEEQRLIFERTRIDILHHIIAEKLDLLHDNEAHYLEEQINEVILKPLDDLRSEVKDLRETLKRHNHEFGGSWTSSARWS